MAKKKAAVKKKIAKKKSGKKGTVRQDSEPALFDADTPIPADLKRKAIEFCEADSAKNRAAAAAKQAKLLLIEKMKEKGFTHLSLPDQNTEIDLTVTDGVRRRKPKKKKSEG